MSHNAMTNEVVLTFETSNGYNVSFNDLLSKFQKTLHDEIMEGFM